MRCLTTSGFSRAVSERVLIIRDQDLLNPDAPPSKSEPVVPKMLIDRDGDSANNGTGFGKPAKDLSVNFVPVRGITHDGITTAPIVVEEDVWIGANVTVAPGVTIGRGSVIGAGAVIAKDVAANSVVTSGSQVVRKVL